MEKKLFLVWVLLLSLIVVSFGFIAVACENDDDDDEDDDGPTDDDSADDDSADDDSADDDDDSTDDDDDSTGCNTDDLTAALGLCTDSSSTYEEYTACAAGVDWSVPSGCESSCFTDCVSAYTDCIADVALDPDVWYVPCSECIVALSTCALDC